MKRIYIAILFLVVLYTGRCAGQSFRWKSQIAPASFVFLAGISDGLVETISHNYAGFKKVFPGANNQFYAPGMSFRNKYKGGIRENGARFPGSTNVLVFTTDGYHLGRFTEHLFLAGAFALKITEGKQRWWVYIVQGLGYWFVNRAGFAMTFNYFQSKR